MADVKIENIVGNIQIAQILDIERIFDLFPNSKYDPTEIPALVINLEDPKSVIMILKNGKLFFSGVKSIEDAHKIKETIVDKLNRNGIKTYKEINIEIMNITTSADLETSIDLSKIADSLDEVEYNPKNFPGLLYKNENQNTVILLFDSGKIVGSGLEFEEISSTIDKMTNEISSLNVI